jgi:hypothetical protein
MNGLQGVSGKTLNHLIPGLKKTALLLAIIKGSAHNDGFSN